ncbi:MAG: hypothetical protein ACYC8T_08690 [Myxococcaceae bacterium]
MMNAPLENYRASGKFSPRLVVYGLLVLSGAVLLSGVYELLLFYIPFIYLNFIIVAAFGAILGVLSAWTLSKGHCRNRTVGILLTLLITGAGLLGSYAWNYRRYVSAVAEANPEYSQLEIARFEVPSWLENRVEGGWRMKSSTINGLAVWGVWGVEALVVLGLAFWLVTDRPKTPYCEGCGRWTEAHHAGLLHLNRNDAEPLIAQGKLAELLSLESRPEELADEPNLSLVRNYCPSCPNSFFLTVTEIRYSRGSKNELKEHKTVLALNVVLSAKLSAQFVTRFGGPATGLDADVAAAAG